jgi:hypothetical protein
MSRPIEPAKEVWRRDRREKVYDAICWTAVGILALFAIPLGLIKRLGALVAIVLLFVHSTLPWWIRVPAGIAVAAGLIYLFLKNRRRRIPPNQKFVD